MKNLLLTTVAVLGLSTAAYAQTEYATITKVQPNYQNISVPTTRTECRTVNVPVYGNVQGNGASGTDVLTGMVLGGLIGKGASGNDKGAAAGAVIGGIIAAENKNNRQEIVGYQQQQQCNDVTFYETQETLKNYTIWYEWNGAQGRSYTYNQYRLGDQIPVTVSINAK